MMTGTAMTGFVRSAAKEKDQSLLEQETRLRLSKRDFAAFNRAINGAVEPNSALHKALKSVTKVKRP